MTQKPLGTTTEKVKTLLEQGVSKTNIAKLLNIRPASVTHHTKKLDKKYQQESTTEHKDWKAIQAYYDEGFSMRDCQSRFGFSANAWQKAVTRGAIKSRNEKVSIVDFLTEESNISSSRLKKKILKEELLKNVCSECGQLPEWNGKPLVLELDHINGNPSDNRIENLRILCGHCHSQTETFCRGHKERKQKESFCECGKKILSRSARCILCANKETQKKLALSRKR